MIFSLSSDVHEAGCSVSADWHDVKSYLDINSHLKGIDKGRYKPQVGIFQATIIIILRPSLFICVKTLTPT